MSASSASRPHSTPMPVGPQSLWPLNATKSAPRACTSVAVWGTDWQPSMMLMAPAARAAGFSTRSEVIQTLAIPAHVMLPVGARLPLISLRPSRFIW